jgi:hypothetical protein
MLLPLSLTIELHTEIRGVKTLADGVIELGPGNLSSYKLLEYIEVAWRSRTQRSPQLALYCGCRGQRHR